jgi:hypothetical protein
VKKCNIRLLGSAHAVHPLHEQRLIPSVFREHPVIDRCRSVIAFFLPVGAMKRD